MELNNKNRKTQNESSTIDILLEYVKYWKWFVLSVVICMIIGGLIVLTTQKQYDPSLSILINEDKGATSSEIDLNSFGVSTTTNNLENEIAILSSPDLMRVVVDSLNLQVSYFTKNIFKEHDIHLNTPYNVYILGDNASFSHIEFYIQKINSSYKILGEYLDHKNTKGVIEQTITSFPYQLKLNNKIQLYIEQTGLEFKNNQRYYTRISDIDQVVSSLCSNLTLNTTSKNSSVIKVSLISNNIEKGSLILTELIKQYNAMNVNSNNEMAYKTAIFINDRLNEISTELDNAEEDVVDFKQQNRITDLGSEAQLFMQQTSLNEQKLLDIETQMNILSMVDQFTNNPANKLKVIPNLGITDMSLSSLITEYNTHLLKSNNILNETGNENPTRLRIEEEISNMRANISSSLNNVKNAYSVSRKNIESQIRATQSRIISVPKQERGLIEKVRQQTIKENLFLFLMQKREENNLKIASTADKARIIISPQENIMPITPKKRIIALCSLILGILIPIIILYISQLLKTKISSRTELEKLTPTNILGEICKNETKEQIVVKDGQNNTVTEMFRFLRNNLNYKLNHKNNKIVLVTSTTSGEGKTFISANLAISFAISGKKVLLLGADIRNPKLGNYLNLKTKKGLTDYLVSNNEWSSYCHKSSFNSNLDIMLSGTIPPNPNELLLSGKLREFLIQAKKEYDFVIVDTAPIGLVSDTFLLEDYADITLYVVREGVTPKSSTNFLNMQQEEGKLKNLYIIYNGVSLNKNYAYGYGKNYGQYVNK